MDSTLKENNEVREKEVLFSPLVWSINTVLNILILLSVKFYACIYGEVIKDACFKNQSWHMSIFDSEDPGFCFKCDQIEKHKYPSVDLCCSQQMIEG